VIRVRRKIADRLEIAPQLVADHDPWWAKSIDQSTQKPLSGLGVPLLLYKYVEHLAICVNGAPEPVFRAIDRDHNLVEIPLFVRLWQVTPDTSGKMRAETIDPNPDCFPAYNHATLGKQILDICRAQREPMISPDGVCDDLTRVAKALQARH
jgi:hypothetical protein